MVLDKEDYEKEMHNILSDTETYRELPNNPTRIYKNLLTALVNKGFHTFILNRKEK